MTTDYLPAITNSFSYKDTTIPEDISVSNVCGAIIASATTEDVNDMYTYSASYNLSPTGSAD